MAAVDAAGGPETDGALEVGIPDIDPSVVAEMQRILALSYALGMYHASPATAKNLADIPSIPAMPYEDAIKFMQSRVPLTKKEWNALEPKLRFRAFTVAGLSTPDAIEQAKGMVMQAIKEGKSKAEFWTDTRAFQAAGLSNEAPFYWENVYRTNIQTAYNTGRVAEFMQEDPGYLEFVGIDDGRQSEICYALTHPAVVLPSTHPFWKTHWPPLHFRCRSTIRGLYPEEIEALRKQNPDWAPSDAETINTFDADTGFGGNPLDEESFWKMTESMVERAQKYGIMEHIEQFAAELGIDRKDIQIISGAGKKLKASKVPAQKPDITSSEKKVSPVEIDFSPIKEKRIRNIAEKAFEQSPDEIRTITAEHLSDFKYRLAPPRAKSSYNSTTKTITMRRSAGPDVFAHEFGHGIDDKVLSTYSQSQEFIEAFDKDLEDLLDIKTGALLELGQRLVRDMSEKGWENIPAVSDLFDGLSAGRIEGNWGHSERYWKEPGNRQTEVFAELFALQSSGETALWNEVAGYIPRLCQAIARILTRR
jgi:hypothetical protein